MLIVYSDNVNSDQNNFEEIINDRCTYYASDLIQLLDLQEESFNEALEKARHGLNTLQLPIKYNIRKIFCVSEDGIRMDIKLSPIAAYFFTIHLDPKHPVAARLQYYFAEKHRQ